MTATPWTERSTQRQSIFDKKIKLVLWAGFFALALCGPVLASKDLQETLIVVSVDGVRHDYLELHHAPTLSALAQTGLKIDFLQPVFPSKTFASHYSLVTGLHPDRHGIVNNTMYDPGFDATFSPGNVAEVQNGRWWGGEPIWVTAQQQGLIAGTFFFPGSEAPVQGVRPQYWFTYDESLTNDFRVETVLMWLDKPAAERPRMITLYFSDVDLAGHGYGPESAEVAAALLEVDNKIADLLDGLQSRNMLDKVNLLIVSDHGMTTVDLNRHAVIDEAFDTELASRIIITTELASIYPHQHQTDTIVRQLQHNLPAGATAYTKATMPERFRYTDNARIAPITVVADNGWRLLNRATLDRMQAGDDFNRLRGGHGYDNLEPDMQGLAIAVGPAFRKASRIHTVNMVDLYNVMAAVLHLRPAANEGDPAIVPLMMDSDYHQIHP
jgi:predicted AlkP superfamily pyrophosphatase or phosphodiesterase